mgnify:CR=1 FL=1
MKALSAYRAAVAGVIVGLSLVSGITVHAKKSTVINAEPAPVTTQTSTTEKSKTETITAEASEVANTTEVQTTETATEVASEEIEGEETEDVVEIKNLKELEAEPVREATSSTIPFVVSTNDEEDIIDDDEEEWKIDR